MPNTPPNLMANGTINVCRFVKLDTTTDNKCVQATANSKIIGVAQEGSNKAPLSDVVSTNYAAEAGEELRLFGDGDVCLLEAGDVVTVGDLLKSDSVGRGVPVAGGSTVEYTGAVALQAAAAAGVKIQVQVQIGNLTTV